MKGVRVILMVAVLANLAILIVTLHQRSTRIKYEVAARQAEARQLAQENRLLLLQRADARQTEKLVARAKALGVAVGRPAKEASTP